MNKTLVFLVFGVFLFSFGSVMAIPNPAPIYCENMGYTANETHCVFTDNESCDINEFYRGSCGQEYVIELNCKELGEGLSPGYECCEGFVGRNNLGQYDEEKDICNWIVGSFGICVACGDGVCDSDYEDLCNCEEDCNASSNEEDHEENTTELDCGEFNEGDCGAEISCTWDDSKDKCKGAGSQNKYAKNKGPVKERVLNYLNATECPEDCKCTGSVVKCEINGTKSMTVIAGNSGNIIIMNKGINASTRVKLIEGENGTLIELANKEQKKLNYLPDEAFDKIKDKLKLSNCTEENNCTVELDYSGKYQIQIERHSRILGIFSKKMNVEGEVDSESGNSKIKKPWWAFLAVEPEE